MRKSNQSRGFFLALLTIFAFSVASAPESSAQAPRPGEKGASRQELRLPISDFSLTDQLGRPFHFQSLKGRVILLSFVYTSCPDVCPLITANALSAQRALRAGEKPFVFFLTVTTDPEVDTPAVLRAYASRFGVDFSNWALLTGEIPALLPVWKAFGVKVKWKARGLVEHTPLTAIVDRQGILRVVYIGSSPAPDLILRDIRALLSNSPPAGRPKT